MDWTLEEFELHIRCAYEARPCPFCGAKTCPDDPLESKDHGPGWVYADKAGYGIHIACGMCGTRGPCGRDTTSQKRTPGERDRDGFDQALSKWNQRLWLRDLSGAE